MQYFQYDNNYYKFAGNILYIYRGEKKIGYFTVNFTNNFHNWQSGKLMAGWMAIDGKIVGNEF